MRNIIEPITRFLTPWLAASLLMGLSALGHADGKVFDHADTGFELIGGHSVLACESCHVGGQFVGTPRNCVGCHSNNGKYNATFKPIEHITASDQCEACHTMTFWEDRPRVDHDQVFGSCNSCHNNLLVDGKPADHFPTHEDCSSCHSNLSWIPARFSHDNLVAECASCHNGSRVIGKPADHMPTLDTCELCHNTNSFAPVYLVDHTAVVGSCVNCHNSGGTGYAPGKPVDHPPTTDFCESCHATTAFVPLASMDHSSITGQCVDCHRNGGVSTSKPADHIPILQDQCDACHTSFIAWKPVLAVDHDFVSDDCRSCHATGIATGQFIGHMETGTIQCSVCHYTTSFSPQIGF